MTLLGGAFRHFCVSLCAGADLSEAFWGTYVTALIPRKEPSRVGVSVLLWDFITDFPLQVIINLPPAGAVRHDIMSRS